jgi:hypothetical protein
MKDIVMKQCKTEAFYKICFGFTFEPTKYLGRNGITYKKIQRKFLVILGRK